MLADQYLSLMSELDAPPGKALVDETTSRLELAIVTGKLAPGQKLSEAALSAAFGVSRGPLREAIRALEGRRLVVRRPYAGARVIDLTADEIEQLLVFREALEGMASRHASENMTLRETRALRETLEAQQRHFQRGEIEAIYREDREHDFHREIARGSRNRFLEDAICRDLFPLLRIVRYRLANVADRQPQVIDEHFAILSAIEQRLPDEAERLMRRHIAGGRDRLLEELRAEPAAGKGRERTGTADAGS